jgi:hypothetical protein
MVILYSRYVEAYAQRHPSTLLRIIISNSLTNLFENGIVPLVLNHIYTIEGQGDSRRFHLLPNTALPSDLASTGDMIIKMAEYYLNPGPGTFVDFSSTPRSETEPFFGVPFCRVMRFRIHIQLQVYGLFIYEKH